MKLAELNIARPRYALDDPRIADFMDNLDRVNGVAERMPGFVWRSQEGSGNATDAETPWPDAIANLSLWDDATSLKRFVWQTVHTTFYARKAEWFDALASHHFVMWWVENGHRPDWCEAKRRLDHLDAHGDTDQAFTWSHLPHVKLWQSQRCGRSG